MQKKVIVCIIGTRPEAIKFMPIVRLLTSSLSLKSFVIASGQHKSLLNQALYEMNIIPDSCLDIMTDNQSPLQVISSLLTELPKIIKCIDNVGAIIVQGDTATAFAGAMIGFSLGIPVAHVEAGLRTYNLSEPYPEEGLRQMIDRISTWCFAPTKISQSNLISEHVESKNIFVTGNTVVDAVEIMRPNLPNRLEVLSRCGINNKNKYLVVTAHRRENQGLGFQEVIRALIHIAKYHPEINIIYPVHPNPNVSKPMNKALSGIENIHLIDPLGYLDFLALMEGAEILISDSGGVQEESSSLSVPVVLLRDVTERPEGVTAGTTYITGCHHEKIIKTVEDLLKSDKKTIKTSPFGNGDAARKILNILERDL